jgi:hypothetical protein
MSVPNPLADKFVASRKVQIEVCVCSTSFVEGAPHPAELRLFEPSFACIRHGVKHTQACATGSAMRAQESDPSPVFQRRSWSYDRFDLEP